jgi:hypothetical protein
MRLIALVLATFALTSTGCFPDAPSNQDPPPQAEAIIPGVTAAQDLSHFCQVNLRQINTDPLVDNAGGESADLLHFVFEQPSEQVGICAPLITYLIFPIEYNRVLQQDPPQQVEMCLNGTCDILPQNIQPGFEQSWDSFWYVWGDPLSNTGLSLPLDVMIRCNDCGPGGSMLRTTLDVSGWKSSPDETFSHFLWLSTGQTRVTSSAILVE